MKTVLPARQFTLKYFLICLLICIASSLRAQTIPELVFKNSVLKTGTVGEDGAVYLFSNVGPGLDAEVTIISRSSAGVILSSIDTLGAGLGYDKSFQPVIGMPGTAPANTNWWMKFNIAFLEAGTSKKAKMAQFNVTGLDIDGDGGSLYEWAQMNNIEKIDSALVNSLTFLEVASHGSDKDYKVSGIVANSPGIDTSALNVMATYTYKNKDNFDFIIGAQTNGSTTTAGMRLNSLWFKQFSLATLPLHLISFSAVYNSPKAELTWKTTSEMNVSHFEIEKSTDGISYTEVGVVLASGNQTDISTYSFSDLVNADREQVIYYRLRMVDIDGQSKYSETRMIRVGKKGQNAVTIVTYPNPATNEVRITVPANWQRKKSVYEVITLAGQTVVRKENANSNQTETVNVNNLSAGIYLLRVSCDGQTAQQRIVKN
jgi:Secretion system C-terminal sorting domain